MNAHALQDMTAGFTHESLGSQAAFRAALQALAHPGRTTVMPIEAECPSTGNAAAAVLLLALLDADCTLWLSPRLAASPTATWLRFHTGCRLVSDPALAMFAWVAHDDAALPLDALAQGSDADPESSATLVLDLPSLHGGRTLELTGPGIRTTQTLQARGLPDDFPTWWQANHAAFPRGVDVFLATPDAIAGLPRTTRIAQPEPQEA